MNVVVPSLWRTELLHPPVVHFPVALLAAAAALSLASMIPAVSRRAPWLGAASRVNLLLGTLAAWIAIWTGGQAEDVVNRLICDPEVTSRHEDLAWWTAYAATAAVGVEILVWRWARSSRLGAWISTLLLVTAGALVLLTGHRGAALVYQQGAGVYHPSESCQEFE